MENSFKNLFIVLAFSFFFSAGCIGDSQPQIPEAEFESQKPSLDRTNYPTDSDTQDDVDVYEKSHPFEISFLNVGFGDATLILSEQKTILFDTGPDTNAIKVKDYMRERGVTSLDLLVLSSNDRLFSSGASDILRSFPVKEVWIANRDYASDKRWDEILNLAKNSELKTVDYGDNFEDGDFELTVLNPFPGTRNPNPATDSIVLKAQYGDFCAVLFSNSEASGASSSDAGTVFGGVDNRIISAPQSVKCPVLRVSAHGSGNSASFQLLDAIGPPEIAVISVGPNPPENKYPNPTLIRRLLLRDIDIYITDRLGDISIKSDGLDYEVYSTYPYGTEYAKFLNDVGYDGADYY